MTEPMLPTGTVTFLFSDMEGSTRLVQDLGPAAFTQVLDQHNTILREAFSGHGGVERGTQGDSFLVMFREAPAATSAAAQAQVALGKAGWAGHAPVRVRMGLHTGIGTLGGDDYVSVDVNRAARIAALAHGGQVLLSDATRALVEGALPTGVSLRPLGEFELKDLARPEHLYQLVIEGVRSAFPALRPIDRPVGNLPDPISSFIGRESELVELASLVRDKRLITLTGPGGTGKTRLAIELARRTAGAFEHGAWLVALDAIGDPDLVPAAIASSFAIVESPGPSPLERLTGYLADRELLLVLDNFEQVLDAAPRIRDLMQAAPRLHILVTSRAPLRLSIEQEYPVAPLGLPEAIDRPGDALASESVRLFVERAGRVRPGYTLTTDDAPAVAEICRRLDGLPLGIELAASRVGLLPPQALAGRLSRQLDVPGSGARDLPARQQTLERAIAWSCDLLEPPPRLLLARLSVFAGGFRLEEAEAVGRMDGEADVDVIEGLTILAEHSLVQSTTGPDLPRFRLLQTIRRFGAARLAESGEHEATQRRHAIAYLALAEEAAQHMPGRDQVPWLDRLAVDHDNLRGAVAWAIETGEAEIAHRLLAAMWRFWQFRGHVAEGRERAEQVLAMHDDHGPTAWRMRALEAAGGLAWWGAGLAEADRLYQSQLELARQVGDEQGIADALFNLSHTRFALTSDPAEVPDLRAEAEALYRKVGDERSLARLAWSGSYILMSQGSVADAEQVARDTLPRSEALGDVFYIAMASTALGGIAFMKGDLDGAFDLGMRGLLASHAMGDVASITLGLQPAAALMFVAGLPGDGATIYAAYEAHRVRYGVQPPLNVEDWLGLGDVLREMRTVVVSGAFEESVRLGASMTTDGVIEFLVREALPRFKDRIREGAAISTPAP
jgi:predicted ATPase/class 3 adenylate cyclase